jgi:PKD repeat protein
MASFTSSCNGLACSFNTSGSSDPDGTIVSYAWTFGDGTTGSGATVSRTYAAGGAFTVTLIVADNAGATSQTSHTVTVNSPPVASFTSACSGLTCSFDASGSSDPDGTIASYAWTFGDGTTGAGATVSRTYAAGGAFTVTLIVTDNAGATGQTAHAVTVNAPPVASFTSACSGLTCSFDASGSSDPDGTIAGYAWTFGDGTTGSGATVTHLCGRRHLLCNSPSPTTGRDRHASPECHRRTAPEHACGRSGPREHDAAEFVDGNRHHHGSHQ